MSSTPMDTKSDRKLYLLEMMSIGLLDRDGANELKQLVRSDIQKTDNVKRKKRLLLLLSTLEDYTSGKIDLMTHPDVTFSNIT